MLTQIVKQKKVTATSCAETTEKQRCQHHKVPRGRGRCEPYGLVRFIAVVTAGGVVSTTQLILTPRFLSTVQK